MGTGRRTVALAVWFAAGCGGDPGDGGSGMDGTTRLDSGPSSADGTGIGTSAGSGGRDSGETSASTAPTTAQPDSSGDGVIFDVGTVSDVPAGDCECGQASEFSYIFIANSPESTVSKIDTLTVTEVGRYLTRSDAAGNPSRTSVSISGRAVAVANRHAGLVKLFTNEEDCVDTNGNGMIDTSTGAGDVRPWGQDECVHWYRDFPGWTVQRPVAWAPGTFDPVQCRWEDEAVWTAGCGGGSPGFGGETTTHVHLIDGETGMDLQVVDLADYSCQGFGPYGGAVDSEGNFWLLQNNGNLARVNRSDFSHQVWGHSPNTAPYGLTVDASGRPWVTSYSAGIGAARFDPLTETWAEAPDPVLVGNGQSGIAQGADGLVWMGVNAPGGLGVASMDPETLAVVDVFVVPGVTGKGISVDGEGYVWRAGWTTATKIDPTDGSSNAYMGLNSAYTYSDMTGFGVANASGCNPAG